MSETTKSEIVSYTSKVGNKELVLEFRVFTDGVVWMEYCGYEPEYIKLFINLLKTSLDDLLSKNYKTFMQKVVVDEWEIFLKKNTDWNIVNEDKNNNTIDISCSLDKAMMNICKGLGLIE